MNHVYFNPVVGTLVRPGVPDHLDEGPLPVADLAQRAGMNELSLTRVLRALTATGTFLEISLGVFANNPVSIYFAIARAAFAIPRSSIAPITS